VFTFRLFPLRCRHSAARTIPSRAVSFLQPKQQHAATVSNWPLLSQRLQLSPFLSYTYSLCELGHALHTLPIQTTTISVVTNIFASMASNTQYDNQASTNYKEAFALFDKRGNQRVAVESLGDLLRACGQNPTLAEIRDLEKNIGADCEWPSSDASRNTSDLIQR
jgi:hypothetical protein